MTRHEICRWSDGCLPPAPQCSRAFGSDLGLFTCLIGGEPGLLLANFWACRHGWGLRNGFSAGLRAVGRGWMLLALFTAISSGARSYCHVARVGHHKPRRPHRRACSAVLRTGACGTVTRTCQLFELDFPTGTARDNGGTRKKRNTGTTATLLQVSRLLF